MTIRNTLQPAARPPATISWWRAAKHGGIAFALLLLLAIVPVLFTAVADPHRYGQGVGQFGTFVFLGVMAASAARQRGMRRTSLILLAAIAVLVAVTAVVVGAAILERA
jgi:hypothetical protein